MYAIGWRVGGRRGCMQEMDLNTPREKEPSSYQGNNTRKGKR